MASSYKKICVYFGHALTNAPEAYKVEHLAARQKLEETGRFDVRRFQGTTDGDCGDVFDTDIIHCVGSCDLFVCDFTLDSNGTGIEFCEAVRVQKKPALILYKKDVRVSRLSAGFAIRVPDLVTISFYEDLCRDIVRLVDHKISIVPRLRLLNGDQIL